MLDLKNVSLKKGGFRLKDISFTLGEGEYLTLVGPTGSGKTMLLNTVIGINRPLSGEIWVDGKLMNHISLQSRPVGIVYQNLYLFPHKNVYDNISFPLSIRKMPKKIIEKKVREAAAFLKIADLLGRSIQNLSGGEKQRVALARALVTERPVLLLDEPLSALDAITKWEIMQELRRIHREKRLTVLHVTHDIEEALFLSDKIGVMIQGKLRQIGSVEEVMNRPSSEEIGQLIRKDNLFKMTYDAKTSLLCKGTFCLYKEGLEDNKEYLVHIPPEDIILNYEALTTSSARNCFKGCIHSIIYHNLGVKVGIDAGIKLVSLLTQRSFQELRLETGKDIYVIFKSNAVGVYGV
ncbi:MAG TPA: ABC transporter ATP-binding protein [Candidatus Aminicenantes bacterium]|nr:ABC transporter ATP-binding protein [Candidatus Aminicenantes bacterium]